MFTLKETLTSVAYYNTAGDEARLSMPTVELQHDADGKVYGVMMVGGDVHPELLASCLRYGVKQILADATAASKGVTEADRTARLMRRAAALRDGTYGLKPLRALVDSDVFKAAVDAGRIVDDERSRTRWASLTKKERAAVRALPDVAAKLPVVESAVGADVLAGFMPAPDVADESATDAPLDVNTDPALREFAVAADHIEPKPKRGARSQRAQLP